MNELLSLYSRENGVQKLVFACNNKVVALQKKNIWDKPRRYNKKFKVFKK
jgi:hypothetical protein